MSDQKNNYIYNPVATMDNVSSNSAADVGGLVAVSGLPSTHSSQQLMSTDTESVITQSNERLRAGINSVLKKEWYTIGVLCFVNLINYMDRFTIAGVLTDIQDDLKIRDDEGGLLQTAFVISYMLFAPIFGYLGDRYSRRWIMGIGVLIWSGTTILGSFMSNYYWFLIFRAFVGIGEASYSTIAPTIISDLFVNDLRSKMLALFYFAIPVGSGLGYIVGSETAAIAGNWRWALRVTPFLGAIAVIMLYFVHEPIRGESEGSHNMSTTTYKEDLKYLVKNRSFMLSTCGFTCVAFVTGALAWWGPKFIYLGLRMQPGNEHITLNEVSFTFGALTMTAGIIGVPLGSYLSQRLNKQYPTADPLLCASGLLISVPLLAGSMIMVSKNTIATYILCFLGQISLNINWAIVADMLLYVVVPTRRSTAEAFQILISHAFGDAGSPYLVGVISEAIKSSLRVATKVSGFVGSVALTSLAHTIEKIKDEDDTFLDTTNSTKYVGYVDDDSNQIKFQGLQYALFSTSFVEVLGGIFFLITAVYILQDKNSASQSIRESHNESSSEDSTLTVSSIDLTLHPRV